MFKNKLSEDSPIAFFYIKIRRRDGVKSLTKDALTTLEEGEFKVPIDGCIKALSFKNIEKRI